MPYLLNEFFVYVRMKNEVNEPLVVRISDTPTIVYASPQKTKNLTEDDNNTTCCSSPDSILDLDMASRCN